MHGPGSLLLLPPASPTGTEDTGTAERHRRACDAFTRSYAGAETIPGAQIKPNPTPGTLPLWVVRSLELPAFDQENDSSPECEALVARKATGADVEKLRARNYDALRGLLRFLAR